MLFVLAMHENNGRESVREIFALLTKLASKTLYAILSRNCPVHCDLSCDKYFGRHRFSVCYFYRTQVLLEQIIVDVSWSRDNCDNNWRYTHLRRALPHNKSTSS